MFNRHLFTRFANSMVRTMCTAPVKFQVISHLVANHPQLGLPDIRVADGQPIDDHPIPTTHTSELGFGIPGLKLTAPNILLTGFGPPEEKTVIADLIQMANQADVYLAPGLNEVASHLSGNLHRLWELQQTVPGFHLVDNTVHSLGPHCSIVGGTLFSRAEPRRPIYNFGVELTVFDRIDLGRRTEEVINQAALSEKHENLVILTHYAPTGEQLDTVVRLNQTAAEIRGHPRQIVWVCQEFVPWERTLFTGDWGAVGVITPPEFEIHTDDPTTLFHTAHTEWLALAQQRYSIPVPLGQKLE